MFGNVYGLDLGTYEIKVYDKKQNTMWKEKNAIAIANEKTIFSVGDAAYEMFEKSPFNIEVVFPMKEGVISHFYDMQYLLQNLLKNERQFMRGSKYIVAVPTDVTEVEKRAFYDLVVHSTAKAKEVRIVERGLADAIGLGLNVQQSPGIFIVNLGGETTELSVLSYGGVVLNKLLKIGGRTMDQAIVGAVRYNNEYLIGKQTAEDLRKAFGVQTNHDDTVLKVAGRNLLNGIPEQRAVPKEIVQSAMKDLLDTLVHEIQFLLERTPPEVQRTIQRSGIYLTGGLANLKGLHTYLEEVLGLPVHKSKQPEYCAVTGLKEIIQTKTLKKLTYSMLDENYRWMR
ncbi:MAG: rod shape-determining protein [Tyzzerella sp.]|nr:rod shape-determining protein [Tyzzerella sp.]